jgi:hypothetical protein
MAETNEIGGVIPYALGDLADVDSAVAPSVDKSGLMWDQAGGEWKVRAPGTAITVPAAITGGESPTEAEHNALITALNDIKAALTAAGITL